MMMNGARAMTSLESMLSELANRKAYLEELTLNLQATADRRLELLREYKVLLMMIINSQKVSIGALENAYMPQLKRDYIDGLCEQLAKELDDTALEDRDG